MRVHLAKQKPEAVRRQNCLARELCFWKNRSRLCTILLYYARCVKGYKQEALYNMPVFRGTRFTDDRLQELNISRIKSLELWDTSVTDQGVSALQYARQLREVCLKSNVIGDACMPVVCSLPSLKSLLLYEMRLITDEGISALNKKEALSELYLKRYAADRPRSALVCTHQRPLECELGWHSCQRHRCCTIGTAA